MDPEHLLTVARSRTDRFLRELGELVSIDSGSDDPAGVNRMADVLAGWLADRGWEVERVVFPPTTEGITTGDALVARLQGDHHDGARVLLMAHMDTVFERGTAAARPFRMDDSRAYGPGVNDDKGGLVTGLHAVDVLREAAGGRFGELIFMLTPDEEIGSVTSMGLVQELASQVDVALCLESARENGDIVSARKGVSDVRIDIRGRAAHAGVEPEKGANAALEAAHKTLALQELNERWPGVTVNVGVIRAGTRRNVIAERADLEVDLRAWTADVFEEALAEVLHIGSRCTVPGTTSSARRVSYYPPMERDEVVTALAEEALEVASQLGLEISHAATGGSADANTAASAGAPTLDGLGPVGGDDHGPQEWISLASIPERVALLAGLIGRLGTRGAPQRSAANRQAG